MNNMTPEKLKYDLTGMRVGKLTVIKPVRLNKQLLWETICDCGNIRHSLTTDLRKEKIKSCGCSRSIHVSYSRGFTPEVIKSKVKVCCVCGIEKNKKGYFYERKDVGDGFRKECIECHLRQKGKYLKQHRQERRDYMKQYRLDNPDMMKRWIENNYSRYLWLSKKWKMEHPDKAKIHKKNNSKKKLLHDPKFRLKANIRRLISMSLKNKGYPKKSKTCEILGISIDGFISHIESQFTDGMSWENKGSWEIDHIIPISLGKTEQDIIRLNHYSNLRPLGKKDNRDKSNVVLDEYKHLVDKYIF